VGYPLRDTLESDLVPHCALIALRSQVTLRHLYLNERRLPCTTQETLERTEARALDALFDARRRAQIRSDVLRQAAEDFEQAQVERRDPLSRDRKELRYLRLGTPSGRKRP
jgi:hypothetical protein